jgi:ribosomal protein S18 acetylase RimI-like enzyme
VGPWRGDARVAYLAPVAECPPPTTDMVRWCCALLVGRGYAEAVTGALAATEQRGFVEAGFEVREELHLLEHDLEALPREAPAVPLRRGRRRDRGAALAVDARAFSPFWRLDEEGFADALAATPLARFRVTGHHPLTGYAVSGLAGRRGYLQRLAVDPERWGRGEGRALVLDSLSWMRRRGARRAVVNTQVGNDRALALYERLGFRLQPHGLTVLTRRLVDHEPAR